MIYYICKRIIQIPKICAIDPQQTKFISSGVYSAYMRGGKAVSGAPATWL